ncbi:MAG: methyltransferase domain-containing protein [Hellea sp.]|nr:methyltransferase domain-containing protein [Hellea sp.]
MSTLDGYVTDSLYPSLLHRYFQVPWIDNVLAIHSVVPPRYGKDSFTLVDLGCGDGIGLILAAASHPQGNFIGIDASYDHIARGQDVLEALGLTNVRLVCARFHEFDYAIDGTADYVTAQGVLSWVTPDVRESFLDLAARLLRPGGAFCAGYNVFPGWHDNASFQALIRTVAAEKPGSSTERFDAAWDQIRDAGLIEDKIWEWLERVREQIPPQYFAHEYLSEGAQPCWSGDVITALGARELAYIGQSSHERLRDDLCYKKIWSENLDRFDTVAAREIAADIYCHSWFRRDIYIKTPALAFEPEEATAARLASYWRLKDDLELEPELQVSTLGGSLCFDSDAARAILAGLRNGPQSLRDIAQHAGIDRDKILGTIDGLLIAKYTEPADPARADSQSERCNEYLAKHNIPINGRASKHGAVGHAISNMPP